MRFLILIGLSLCIQNAAAEPVFVGGSAIVQQTFSPELARRILTGKVSIVGGVEIQLGMPRDGPDGLGKALPSLGLDTDTFRRGWLRRVLSGYGSPPRQLDTASAIRWVLSNSRGLALVFREQIPANSGVKILRIVKE